MSSMGITAVSMLDSLERLNVISHNLANVNTTGYKRDIAISRNFDAQLSSNAAQTSLVAGGYSPNAIIKHVPDMSAGSMHHTGNALHVAIEGKGFFEVFDGTERLYSRDGAFQRDSAGRLVNAKGLPVAGKSGEIRLGDGEVFIDAQGRIFENEKIVDQLNVVDFANPERLEKRVAGMYASKGETGLPLRSESVKVRQGYLETSNVDVMQEMVDLMSTLRQFEMSQHVLRDSDETLGKAIESLGKF